MPKDKSIDVITAAHDTVHGRTWITEAQQIQLAMAAVIVFCKVQEIEIPGPAYLENIALGIIAVFTWLARAGQKVRIAAIKWAHHNDL